MRPLGRRTSGCTKTRRELSEREVGAAHPLHALPVSTAALSLLLRAILATLTISG